MKKINTHNYEAYFLDYTEGNLNESQIRELKKFLNVNPKLKEELHDFQPPLDIVDGAARVCDPFFDGILTGKHWSGKFLKDYFPIDW